MLWFKFNLWFEFFLNQFKLFELTRINFMPTIRKYMTCCSQKTIEKETLGREHGFIHQISIPHFSPKQLKFITTSFNWDHTYQHGYTVLASTRPSTPRTLLDTTLSHYSYMYYEYHLPCLFC